MRGGLIDADGAQRVQWQLNIPGVHDGASPSNMVVYGFNADSPYREMTGAR